MSLVLTPPHSPDLTESSNWTQITPEAEKALSSRRRPDERLENQPNRGGIGPVGSRAS